MQIKQQTNVIWNLPVILSACRHVLPMMEPSPKGITFPMKVLGQQYLHSSLEHAS